jgi:hypothetical protein
VATAVYIIVRNFGFANCERVSFKFLIVRLSTSKTVHDIIEIIEINQVTMNVVDDCSRHDLRNAYVAYEHHFQFRESDKRM